MKVCQMADEKFLKKELHSLLVKGVIEYVPLPEREREAVPKKNGGLYPNLDLRFLNHTLLTYRFKMLTLKLMLSEIQFKDWFVTIDLQRCLLSH